MQSDRGFAYSRALKLIGVGLFGIFALISFVNNPLTINGLIPLLLGVFFLLLSLLSSLFLPDTKTVKISENGIIIVDSDQPTEIKTEEILRIANYTSFTNHSLNFIDFYKIELKKNSVYKSPVFFKASSDEARTFVKALKTKWVKVKGSNNNSDNIKND